MAQAKKPTISSFSQLTRGDSTSRFKTRKEKLTKSPLCYWREFEPISPNSLKEPSWYMLGLQPTMPYGVWALFGCYVIAPNILHGGGVLALICCLVFLNWERTSMFKGRTGSWSDKRNRNQPPYPETRICRSKENVWKDKITTPSKALGHIIDLMTEVLYSMVFSRLHIYEFLPLTNTMKWIWD